MPQRQAFFRMALSSFAAWAITLLFYFVGIAAAAAGLQRAPASTASTAVVILVAVEIIIAGLAVTFVFIRSRGYFGTAARAIWTVIFAALQLGTGALAALVSLVVLNR
jgi:hypothetical protein